jgi:pyruvate,water dikinase
MDVYWLDDEGCRDPARVGGKAAQLARLAGAYPVPPGFCLAARGPEAGALAAGERAELVAAYTRLGQQCGTSPLPVAVRSSAVDEDGAEASFAGQHESYLNVVGAGAVAASAARCLASTRASRAQAYRRAWGLDAAGGAAVLVQELVVADTSAVVFSVDPRTGRDDRVVINATWGLGESLVGGTVVPDLYEVRKGDLSVVARHVSDKARMTVTSAQPGGATREVPVPGPMRREAALDADQIVELARLACQLEQAQGWPVDLECAYRHSRLYLLQCRPVTALGRATTAAPSNASPCLVAASGRRSRAS